MTEEALQIAVKRREVKNKREKGKIFPFEELYTLHLNYRSLILLSFELAEVTGRYHYPSSLKFRTWREIKRACGKKITFF